MFKKILIANRGEIALRVFRTARKMGILTVAIYTEDEKTHATFADESCLMEGDDLKETYLNQNLIITLALQTRAEAIHPGYGFLSENASFARKVEEAGMAFIGATPGQIELMGDKIRASAFVRRLGVPVVPSAEGTVAELLTRVHLPPFPVLVKAAAGGGGRGMQRVEQAADLPSALQKAEREAKAYFGSETLFIEQYLPRVRHVEVQLMGDGEGNVVHLFDRDCSTQRRYQKLLEEAPAGAVSGGLRERMHQWAVAIGRAVRYRGAGTVEFLVDEQGNAWFIEMNTRLQVEHPVTESVTGEDLVEWQLLIAGRMGLPKSQEAITLSGYAVEVRLCAEDPEAGFRPSAGTVTNVYIPGNVRWDSFIGEDTPVSPGYDSLLGKLIVHRPSREESVKAMEQTLESMRICGVKTNRELLVQVLRSEIFRTNRVTACFLENNLSELLSRATREREQISGTVLAAAYLVSRYGDVSPGKDLWFRSGYWRLYNRVHAVSDNKILQLTFIKRKDRFCVYVGERTVEVSGISREAGFMEFRADGRSYRVGVRECAGGTVIDYGAYSGFFRPAYASEEKKKTENGTTGPVASEIVAGLFGRVLEVFVEQGDRLRKGQRLLTIESMKTEFTIQSPGEAVVGTVHVKKGKMIHDREVLVELVAGGEQS